MRSVTAVGSRLSAALMSMLLVIGIQGASAQIQVEKGMTTPPLGDDTLCFRYKFLPNDTLVYVVESADSVNFIGDPILLKIRREVLTIVCDSVTPNEEYILALSLRESIQKQSTANDTASVSTSPWVDRTAYIKIDTLGNRLDLWVDDPSIAAAAPGGPFQPIPIPTLGEACGVQNQSWLVSDTTLLPENAVPPPTFQHNTLWRVIDSVDTLDRTFDQIQYTQTALGRMALKTNEMDIDMTATIASFGKLSMDRILQVPYHLTALSEDRLEITSGNGRVKKGQHRVSSHYQLVAVSSTDPGRRFRLPP